MKITLESTTKLVALGIDGATVPARVWQGETESGIPVHAFITRIAPEIEKTHPQIDELTAEFARDLQRCADPRPSIAAIPLKLII